MWGAVGGIGMRWKAFASEDFLNDVPDALLSIEECGKVLHCTAVYLYPPEWVCSQKFDDQTRQGYLRPTAGQIKLDVAEAAAELAQLPDHTALQGLPDVDRRPVPGNFTESPLGGLAQFGVRRSQGKAHRFEGKEWSHWNCAELL